MADVVLNEEQQNDIWNSTIMVFLALITEENNGLKVPDRVHDFLNNHLVILASALGCDSLDDIQTRINERIAEIAGEQVKKAILEGDGEINITPEGLLKEGDLSEPE